MENRTLLLLILSILIFGLSLFLVFKVITSLSNMIQILFFLISVVFYVLSIIFIVRLFLKYREHIRTIQHEREQFEREISHRENLLRDLSFRVATSIQENDNTHDSEHHGIIKRLYTNLINCISQCLRDIFG